MTSDATFETVFDQGELIALAREDFGVFIESAFAVLHDGASLDHAPYLDVIVEAVSQTRKGGSKRLIINMPPGHMKSMAVSVIYSAWLLGVDPTMKIMSACYGDDLTHKLSRAVRKLMSSPFTGPCFQTRSLKKRLRTLSKRRKAESVTPLPSTAT